MRESNNFKQWKKNTQQHNSRASAEALKKSSEIIPDKPLPDQDGQGGDRPQLAVDLPKAMQ